MAISSTASTNTALDKILSQSSPETAAATKEARKVGEMGKDQFLTLLITQLQNQDPMNPTDDKEFIGQMAQFSALEQMQNLNLSMSSLRGINYIGKTVSGSYVDAVTKETKNVDGIVSNVSITKDGIVAKVNGTDVPIEKITSITDSQQNTGEQDVSRYTGYIGYKVKGTYEDADGNNLAVSGIVKEVAKGINHEEAMIDGVKVNIMNVDSPTRLSSAEDKLAYLESQKGNLVTVSTADDTGNYAMKTSGTLSDYSVDAYGTITVELDGVMIPIKSVRSVMDSK